MAMSNGFIILIDRGDHLNYLLQINSIFSLRNDPRINNSEQAFQSFAEYYRDLVQGVQTKEELDAFARRVDQGYLVKFYAANHIADTDYEIKTKVRALFVSLFIQKSLQIQERSLPEGELFLSRQREMLEMLDKQPLIETSTAATSAASAASGLANVILNANHAQHILNAHANGVTTVSPKSADANANANAHTNGNANGSGNGNGSGSLSGATPLGGGGGGTASASETTGGAVITGAAPLVALPIAPKLSISDPLDLISFTRFYAVLREAQRWQTHAKWEKFAFYVASMAVGEGIWYCPGGAAKPETLRRKHLFAIMERMSNKYHKSAKKRKSAYISPSTSAASLSLYGGASSSGVPLLPGGALSDVVAAVERERERERERDLARSLSLDGGNAPYSLPLSLSAAVAAQAESLANAASHSALFRSGISSSSSSARGRGRGAGAAPNGPLNEYFSNGSLGEGAAELLLRVAAAATSSGVPSSSSSASTTSSSEALLGLYRHPLNGSLSAALGGGDPLGGLLSLSNTSAMGNIAQTSPLSCFPPLYAYQGGSAPCVSETERETQSGLDVLADVVATIDAAPWPSPSPAAMKTKKARALRAFAAPLEDHTGLLENKA